MLSLSLPSLLLLSVAFTLTLGLTFTLGVTLSLSLSLSLLLSPRLYSEFSWYLYLYDCWVVD